MVLPRDAGLRAAKATNTPPLPALPPQPETVAALLLRLTGVDLTRCPLCRGGRLHVVGLLRPGALPVPVWDASCARLQSSAW